MHFYMHSYLHKIFILVKSGCYKVPVVQPLQVIETPEDSVDAHAAPLSGDSDRTMGLH
jgi:hypothetical protein